MLLREWLAQTGARSIERVALTDIKHFAFGEDYYIEVMDGRKFQDNDLDRMLELIYDEFNASKTTAMLKGGRVLSPMMEFPFVAGKPVMHVRPVEWTSQLPAPDLDVFIETMRQQITWFNLSGKWTNFGKDNL